MTNTQAANAASSSNGNSSALILKIKWVRFASPAGRLKRWNCRETIGSVDLACLPPPAKFAQMDFKISDLTGLSAPLTRLIEVISEGVGRVMAPYLVASTARGKGKEIQQIAQAIKSATNNAPLDISYDDAKIAIKTLDSQKFVTAVSTIENRASERIHFEGAKQQLNLENVSSHAALELLPEQSVPDTKPDEDWTARFFDYAKNISSEQMQ